MPELMVTLDTGETVRLSACDWVFTAACGCPIGCMLADIGGEVYYDEDQALRSFFDEGTKRATDARIKRELKAGVEAELMTHERYKVEVAPLMLARCPHGQQELAVEEVVADA